MKSDAFTVVPVGIVGENQGLPAVIVEEKFRPALAELELFSHVIVVWWSHQYFEGCELMREGEYLAAETDYSNGHTMGIFATRSPVRPNPICVSVARLEGVERKDGVVRLRGIDAFAGSPVLDLKPYYACLDRVRQSIVPGYVPRWGEWCAEEMRA